jgi:hypothetical protein
MKNIIKEAMRNYPLNFHSKGRTKQDALEDYPCAIEGSLEISVDADDDEEWNRFANANLLALIEVYPEHSQLWVERWGSEEQIEAHRKMIFSKRSLQDLLK